MQASTSLNQAQLQILKAYSSPLPEAAMKELNSILVKFLADKLVDGIEEESQKRGYTDEQIEGFRSEHSRSSSK